MATDATAPTCARHPDRVTDVVCPRCGRPTCGACLSASGDGPGCEACREEAGPEHPRPPDARRPAVAAAPVTMSLLAVIAAVFVAGRLSDDLAFLIAFSGEQDNELVMAGQWWRVLTATLLHSGIPHLLFNGYALYVLGAELERGVGSAAFAALYVASALAGGIAFLLAAPSQSAVGASGAIFGLFGAWFAASWVNRDTPQGRAGVAQLGLLLAINMALPLVLPGIAWQAHLGGLIAGVLIGLGWARLGRRATPATPAERVTLPVAIAGALLAVLLWYTWA